MLISMQLDLLKTYALLFKKRESCVNMPDFS